MGITYTLPNFPQLNQNSTPPLDGFPDADHSWECVPTAIADGMRYLLGAIYAKDGTPLDGDGLRDRVYGPNYPNGKGESAASYVAWCASQGVALIPFNGSPAALVARIHSEIAAGHPVVATIPSEWGIPRIAQKPGYTTHVICFCGYGPSMLRATNPWTAPLWHDGDDTYWTDRLCENQVWIMERNGVAVGVPAGWHDDGKTLTAPNGVKVVLGKRNYVLTHPWDADDWPLSADVYVAHPDPLVPTGCDGSYQPFRKTWLVWQKCDGNIFPRYMGEVLNVLLRAVQTPPPAPPAAPQTYTVTLTTSPLAATVKPA